VRCMVAASCNNIHTLHVTVAHPDHHKKSECPVLARRGRECGRFLQKLGPTITTLPVLGRAPSKTAVIAGPEWLFYGRDPWPSPVAWSLGSNKTSVTGSTLLTWKGPPNCPLQGPTCRQGFGPTERVFGSSLPVFMLRQLGHPRASGHLGCMTRTKCWPPTGAPGKASGRLGSPRPRNLGPERAGGRCLPIFGVRCHIGYFPQEAFSSGSGWRGRPVAGWPSARLMPVCFRFPSHRKSTGAILASSARIISLDRLIAAFSAR